MSPLLWWRRGGGDEPATDTVGEELGLREAVQEDWFWGRLNAAGTEEDRYWRRLSDGWGMKDLAPATYLDLHNQVYEAYHANPLANAIIETGVNFVLGEGLRIEARDLRVQRVIDNFWNDPDNHLNLRQYDLATELSLYGELFIRLFVNPFTGAVKIAMIDPATVDEIETDPENVEKVLRIHRRPLVPALPERAAASSPDGLPAPAPTADFPRGDWFSVPDEVLHFAVNKVTGAKRGNSDLATVLPWLRRYKDWLIDRVRINRYKVAFLWDVQLQGADRKTIEAKLMEYSRPPEPGSVLVHNESEQWRAVQPNIDAGSVAEDGHAIKLMVAAGAGLPEHYLGEGGDVNRATAAEMGLPALKKYARRQDYLGYLLRTVIDRVLLEARRAGTLPASADLTYTVHFPPLQSEDGLQAANAAYYLAQALQIARSMDLIPADDAAAAFRRSVGDEGL